MTLNLVLFHYDKLSLEFLETQFSDSLAKLILSWISTQKKQKTFDWNPDGRNVPPSY